MAFVNKTSLLKDGAVGAPLHLFRILIAKNIEMRLPWNAFLQDDLK